MKQIVDINIFGYAVGLAGNDSGTAFAPLLLKKSTYLQKLPLKLHWHGVFYIKQGAPRLAAIPDVANVSSKLAEGVCGAAEKGKRFLVFGGDHSSGIGTWSGASRALSAYGDLGVIWLDAHLDSHTTKTTPSCNVHGMTLALLLGHGHKDLKSILHADKKIKPQNVCVIGARSYEEDEVSLLNKLGVRIYFIEEVRDRGLKVVFNEAVQLVSRETAGFGISIDMDLFDPAESPGVGVPEPGGLTGKEFLRCCKGLAQNSHFIGMEIVEFNPLLDQNHKSEQLIAKIIRSIFC